MWEKPLRDKCKESINDCNYDDTCTVTSLSVWNYENVGFLIFVPQTVPISHVISVALKYYWAREFLFPET
jgi:hypothetical protein